MAGRVTVAGLTQQPLPRDFPGQAGGSLRGRDSRQSDQGQPRPRAMGLSPLCSGSSVSWPPFAHLPP